MGCEGGRGQRGWVLAAWSDVGGRAGRGGLGQCGQAWSAVMGVGGVFSMGGRWGQGLAWAAWMGGCRQPQLRSANSSTIK